MHDISDIEKKPDTKIPCLGCGQRDGLIAPITGKEAVLWCMRCGTLIDTEDRIDALVPQLLRNTLMSLGNVTTSEDQKKQIAEQLAKQEQEQPAEDSSEASPPPGA